MACTYEDFLSMRVLMITGSYPPMKCGVGSYTKKLATVIAECYKVEVTVLTDKRASQASEENGVTVVPIMNGWQLTEFFKIVQLVKHLKPDVVHIQYPTQGYLDRLSTRFLPLLIHFLGAPCVQTWHEPILRVSGVWLSIGADALVIVKEELMAHIPWLTRIAIFSAKPFWVPCASLLPAIVLQESERLEIRNRYVSNDELLLVYYGFVAPLKGVETLFEITAQTGAKLLMVCDFQSDDIYHQLLLDLIVSMGIETKVNIVGFLPDDQLVSVLAASDAVVLPFKSGARDWNTTVASASAQGVFVLTTSFICNGYNKEQNIYYAKPGNTEEMVLAIKKYAGHYIPCRSSMSEWESIADEHVRIYKGVI